MSNSSKAITLATRVPNLNNKSLEEIMKEELESRAYNFSQVDPRPYTTPAEFHKLPPQVQKNTTREFKDQQKQFLMTVAQAYGSFFVTRQMVVAVNLLNDHVSCPNYLNKNAFCMTSVRGLYHLPEWAFPRDFNKSIRETMNQRRINYRDEQKRLADEAKAEAAKAEAEAKSTDETSSKKKSAAKPSASKTSKKKASSKKKSAAASATTPEKPEVLEPIEESTVIETTVDPNLAAEAGAEPEETTEEVASAE